MDSKEIAFAEYLAELDFEDADKAKRFANTASAVIESGELMAEKKSKKGIKTVNLCEMVKSFSADAENEVCKIKTVISANTADAIFQKI